MPFAKAIGQAIFKQLAPEAMSAAAMIKVAQKLGGSYRRTEMLADIRQYTGRIKYQLNIESLRANSAVPRGWMVETTLNEPLAKYRVFGKAKFYDLRTGAVHEQTVSFYHDQLMFKSNYAITFNEFFKGGYNEQDMELLSFEQTALEHNLGQSY